MSFRTLLVLSLCLGAWVISPVAAQDQSLPEVENSRFQFAGEVNANSVYVRSGPGENYYPVLKLDKGTPVTVVGIKFEWLKITPPEGSFSYVAKAYVEKRGDGTVGRVTKPDLNVRAGSALNAMKTTVQTKLDEGQDVTILGEQDEYFKIKPPAGAFVYVHKQFVNPVQPIARATEGANQPQAAPVDQTAANRAAASPEMTEPAMIEPTPAQQQAGVATTQPALSAADRFDQLEAEFSTVSQKPIEDQPLPELLASYEVVAKDDQLPESMRRIAAFRISILKLRVEAREQFLAMKQIQEESAKRQTVLAAERSELEDRIKQHDVQIYTALGTLQTSSLQQGRATLYRLTDPATARTVVYIRSDDPKVVSFLGQFIGVRGEAVVDQQLTLRVITPTEVEAVDPSKVNTNVTAQIIPPSLLPKGSQLSSGAQ